MGVNVDPDRPNDPGWPEDLEAQRARFRGYAEIAGLGWFERLYAEAVTGSARVPWDLGHPDPLLADWLVGWQPSSSEFGGRPRALVVGCGLGRDAEFVAELGFETTAFDISETAIRSAQRRFPESEVSYQVADLLDPPPSWTRGYDLVVECITVQALPESLRPSAIHNVARMVGDNGSLIVIALRQPTNHEPASGPPWPLTRPEIDAFATDGLEPVRIEQAIDPTYAGRRERWRAAYHRPLGQPRPGPVRPKGAQ